MASAYKEPDGPPGVKVLRIMLLGVSGVGKSSTGNAILGRRAFKESGTLVSELQGGRVEYRNISVIDTPGFNNTELTDEELQNEMMKSLSLSYPGPHVFLLIVRLDRFTEDVRKIVRNIQENFGEEYLMFTMVLFIGREKMSRREFKQFIENEKTKELLNYFKGRYHVINSKNECATNHIMKLLQNIDEMVWNNGGGHYNSEIYLKTQNELREDRKRKEQDELRKRHMLIGETQEDVKEKQCDIPINSSELRIVLLGVSGVGKSATGNAILGREAFKESGTLESELQGGRVEDRNISVIDTPGFNNTKLTDEQLQNEMMMSLCLAYPGPHVFLLIIRLDRTTEDVRKIVQNIQENFGAQASRFTVVLFTQSQEMSIREWIEFRLDRKTRELLNYCEEKYHLLFPKNKRDRSQISSLLKNIDEVVRKNRREHYTIEIFMKIRREEEKRQEEDRTKCQKEKERRAQKAINLERDITWQEKEEKNRAEDWRQEEEWNGFQRRREQFEKDRVYQPERRPQHTEGRQIEKELEGLTLEREKIMKDDLRIVLLGKTGTGKSATGNTILGREVFTSVNSAVSHTKSCEIFSVEQAGRTISIIDTPGVFDTSMSEEQVKPEIVKCVCMSAPGPHAFLLVVRADGRFTDEEKNTVKWIQKNFGKNALNYTIILFTHAERLGDGNISVYFRESEFLQSLVNSCGGCHSLSNVDKDNQDQVTELLMKIDKMVEKNGGTHYTNEMYEEAQKIMKWKNFKEKATNVGKFALIALGGAVGGGAAVAAVGGTAVGAAASANVATTLLQSDVSKAAMKMISEAALSLLRKKLDEMTK